MATDERVSASDALDATTVERMITAVDDAWDVREAFRIDDGGSETVSVTVETGDSVRECVLKATDDENGGGELAAEATLLRLLGAETAVPVPEVYGIVDGHPDLPAPFFLMERADGDPLPANVSTVPDGELVAYARQVGRSLGRVHCLDAFDAYGPIVDAERVDPTDAGGELPLAPEYGLALEDPHESWASRLQATAKEALERLGDTRFRDLASELRAAIDRQRDGLDLTGRPAIARIDYNPRNLVVDRGSRTVTGLLDWELARTTHPEYELVCAEQGFCGTDTLDSERRNRVRSGLYEGYDRTAGHSPGDGFEERRRLYRLVFVTEIMNWVDGGVGPENADVVERDYREFVAELL
ncbi:phosphotransferase family protein [Halosimplex sp. J119]